MIVKRIFKMKKLLMILLIGFLLLLSGCRNVVKPNEGQITLYLDEEFTQYMNYEEIPSFTLTFSGVINTSDVDRIKTYQTIFASNDDLKLSGIISDLFNRYQNRMEVVIVEVLENRKTARLNTYEDGELKQLNYPTDDEKEYYEVAYIDLENGLKLTLDYRRFISNGINYYVWRYTSLIGMSIYYPLMVINNNGTKEFVILTLPNLVTFQVGPQLKAKNVINDKNYLASPTFYSFEYLDKFETFDEKKQYVIDYYVNGYEGYFEGDKLLFTYLGVKFKVTFNDTNFYIEFVEKV